MLQIETLSVTAFQQNARILFPKGGGDGVIVDPGGEAPKLLALAERLKVRISQIWLTHSHLDHCGAVAAVKRATNATLYAHPAESVMRREVRSIATMYGIPAGDFEPCPEPEVALVGGEELSVGGVPFAVRFTPGHSPGHLSFYSSMLGVVIGGDTLFQGGIGRTDLPGGNHEQLLSSIVRELLSLPDPTRVLSGHGPETTIGEERVYNPFLHDGILEQS